MAVRCMFYDGFKIEYRVLQQALFEYKIPVITMMEHVNFEPSLPDLAVASRVKTFKLTARTMDGDNSMAIYTVTGNLEEMFRNCQYSAWIDRHEVRMVRVKEKHPVDYKAIVEETKQMIESGMKPKEIAYMIKYREGLA